MKITRSELKRWLYWTVVIVVPFGSLLLIRDLRRIRTLLRRVHEELNKHRF